MLRYVDIVQLLFVNDWCLLMSLRAKFTSYVCILVTGLLVLSMNETIKCRNPPGEIFARVNELYVCTSGG